MGTARRPRAAAIAPLAHAQPQATAPMPAGHGRARLGAAAGPGHAMASARLLPATPKVERPARARRASDPSAPDHLTTYFRDLAEHDLLDADQERELARGLQAQETLAWERVLSHPDAAVRALTLVDGQFEEPIDLAKVRRAAEAAAARPRDARALSRLVTAAREAAPRIRAVDLDRVHLDAVVRDLERARALAQAGEASPVRTAGHKAFATFLAGVHEAQQASGALRDEFVRANLRLVVTMARRYDRGGMPLPDLIQEGNLGLMHAVGRFDHLRGLRFSTYACWWIRHAIGRGLADKARAVRIPVHMLEAQQQLEKVRQQQIRELGRPPTPQELAKAARLPLAKLNQMHRFLMGGSTSLDRPIHDDDDRAFGDTLADPATEDSSPADDMTSAALGEQVTRLMHHLTPIEADVIRKRFGLTTDEEQTFREIGDEYRLSRERIRQIQNAALGKLRRAIEREHHGRVVM
ncbi:MAG: sigma-70 family RNA polymerase sigma factor [Kofleriaceae bacterium]|nr:sigma-70 family RNA polymerase sigma factor [Kofleriaceae bacterium]MBP6841043.1 sigma-70 family RNA polymerase sigma factor [Kofleriaceae bacterium]MBP9205443.1 sigma-70 family RNA polymerase sigma factor [Kofleriaceae bacterium]